MDCKSVGNSNALSIESSRTYLQTYGTDEMCLEPVYAFDLSQLSPPMPLVTALDEKQVCDKQLQRVSQALRAAANDWEDCTGLVETELGRV
jgi:hypothetical protein